MERITSCVAAAVAPCALGTPALNERPDPPAVVQTAVRVEPIRAAPFVLDEDGWPVVIGEWTDYQPGAQRAGSLLAFDCFEPDSGGIPTDGRYGVDCGMGAGRMFLGPAYCNTYAVNDMIVGPGAQGVAADRVEFAWWWQVTGPGSFERCLVAVGTAEDFDPTCIGPASNGQYQGVVYDFGVLQASVQQYYFADIDLSATPWRHQMPDDGNGAYSIFLARAQAGPQLIPATCAQPMLWATKPANPSQQGPIQWNDDNPPDGVHTPPVECAPMPHSCAGALGAMCAFYAPVGGRDCNRNLWADAVDLSSGSSADRNFNGEPDECDLDVSFDQLDWLDNFGGFTLENSDWGAVNVGLRADSVPFLYLHAEGGLYCWVNIVTRAAGTTGANWAVQNLPLHVTDVAAIVEGLPCRLYFDLGTTPPAATPSIDYLVRLTADALAVMPSGADWVYGSAVGEAGVLDGGVITDVPGLGPISGNSGEGPPSGASNYICFQDSNLKLGKSWKIKLKDGQIDAVDEDLMGCVPASVARSLEYLDDTNGNFSVDAADAEAMYDVLKGAEYMGTSFDPTNGGTKLDKVKAAKQKYLKDKATGQTVVTNTTSDFETAGKQLGDGADLEIEISWGTSNGKTSGHSAFVTEITEILSGTTVVGYKVCTIDDETQGDNKASNVKREYIFDKNGKLTSPERAADAKLIKFFYEGFPKPLPGKIPGVPSPTPPIPGGIK